MDTQTIKIRVDSWMSFGNKGQVKLRKLMDANSAVTTDIDIYFGGDERYDVIESTADVRT